MTKCPRCKLPQEEMYRCLYCGYKLPQGRRGHIKLTCNKLNSLIVRFKIDQNNSDKIGSNSQSINYSERRFKMR
jgi:hypothetical protein